MKPGETVIYNGMSYKIAEIHHDEIIMTKNGKRITVPADTFMRTKKEILGRDR